MTSLEKEHFEYYIEIDGEGRADGSEEAEAKSHGRKLV